jgi:predicted Zn-dependent protease
MNPQDLVETALELLDEGVVILRESHGRNVRVANSSLTTNGDMRATTMSVISAQPVAGGTGVGVMTGQVTGTESACELAVLARAAADGAPSSDRADLIDAGVTDDYDAAPAALDDDTTSTMLGAVATFLDSPAAQFGYSEADRTTTYLATSAGTRYRHTQDSVRFEASARDASGSTWWGTNTWQADFPAAALAQTHDLALQQQREDLAPGRHPVILTPGAVADLLIYLAWSASARDAVEGHNVFARPGGGTRLGDWLTRRALTLYADPAFPGVASADRLVVDANSSMESVFDNGLPLARQDLIRNGQLVALRASRPTASRFGVEPAHLADNLILTDADGHGNAFDLVARTGDAVLINCLWYIREVDPQNLLLTGLTRDGVYRVRDGQVVAALPNFRFNVSVPDLLGRVLDASATAACLPREWADWFTRTAMPALLIDGFNLSSPSEAR